MRTRLCHLVVDKSLSQDEELHPPSTKLQYNVIVRDSIRGSTFRDYAFYVILQCKIILKVIKIMVFFTYQQKEIRS